MLVRLAVTLAAIYTPLAVNYQTEGDVSQRSVGRCRRCQGDQAAGGDFFISGRREGAGGAGGDATSGSAIVDSTGGTAGKGKGDAVTLAIRPEKIRLVKIDGGTEGLKGRVAECIYTGTDTNYQVDLEKSDVRLVVRGRNAVAPVWAMPAAIRRAGDRAVAPTALSGQALQHPPRWTCNLR